ncbi:MAG: hypothetical protein HYX25_05980 [Candidatus Solibacter usitatus]|nr:hypothetical protein [Candidatus Solibacter usitatus]
MEGGFETRPYIPKSIALPKIDDESDRGARQSQHQFECRKLTMNATALTASTIQGAGFNPPVIRKSIAPPKIDDECDRVDRKHDPGAGFKPAHHSQKHRTTEK